MRKKVNRISAARFAVFALLIIYVAVLAFRNGKSSVSFQTVEAAVTEAADFQNLQLGTGQDLKKFYGLNEKDFDAVCFYYASQSMGVDELLLVASDESEKIEEAEDAAEQRIETQLRNFEGYGEEQTKLLQDAVLIKKGNFFLLAVSPQGDEIKEKFLRTV